MLLSVLPLLRLLRFAVMVGQRWVGWPPSGWFSLPPLSPEAEALLPILSRLR